MGSYAWGSADLAEKSQGKAPGQEPGCWTVGFHKRPRLQKLEVGWKEAGGEGGEASWGQHTAVLRQEASQEVSQSQGKPPQRDWGDKRPYWFLFIPGLPWWSKLLFPPSNEIQTPALLTPPPPPALGLPLPALNPSAYCHCSQEVS
jgi:hypothetical protein